MEAAVTVRGTCLSGPFAWQDASVSTDAFEGLRPHHDLPDVRVLVASPQLAKRAAGRVCREERADGDPGGFCDGSHRVELRDALATQIGDAALLQADKGSEQAVGPEWIVLETSSGARLVLGSVEDGYAFRQGDSLLFWQPSADFAAELDALLR